MDLDSILSLTEISLAVVGGMSALAGGIYGGYRFCKVAGGYWRTLRDLHSCFGHDAAKTLAEIIRNIEATQGELEVRRLIVERHLKIGVYVCDERGDCTWCNDVLADLFHLDTTEILHHGWIAAVRRSDRHAAYETWKRAVADRLPYKESYVVEPEAGEPWEAITEAWPVFDQKGKVLCYVGYVVPRS